MTKDKTYLIYLALGLSCWLIILVAFYTYYYLPQRDITQAKINNNQAMIAQAEQFRRNYPHPQSLEQNLQKRNKILQSQIPPNLSISSLIAELNTAALTNNVEILEIRPEDEPQQTKEYTSQKIQVEIQGQFFPLLGFYKKIHNSPRLIILNSGQMHVDNDIIKSAVTLKIFAEKI